LTIGTLGSSSVDCNYNNYDFYAVGSKYRCEVSNNLNISSPESAEIVAVTGAHMSGKSNNDEIYFHAEDKHIEYFPRGLEKFFTKLTGIAIWRSQLKEIRQDDLKPYTKLKNLYLSINNIEVIENGLFDYQPDIEVIIFEICKIFHISLTVFDNLPKLTTLYLYGNNCTNQYSTHNRAGVLEVIKSVKSTCVSSEFLKLDEKLKNLEKNSKNLNYDNFASFKVNLENFKLELNNSKFSNFQPFRSRLFEILDWNLKILVSVERKIGQLEKTIIDIKNESQKNTQSIQTRLNDFNSNNTKELSNINIKIGSLASSLEVYKTESKNKIESVHNDLRNTKIDITTSLNTQKSSLEGLISSQNQKLSVITESTKNVQNSLGTCKNEVTNVQEICNSSISKVQNELKTFINDQTVTIESKFETISRILNKSEAIIIEKSEKVEVRLVELNDMNVKGFSVVNEKLVGLNDSVADCRTKIIENSKMSSMNAKVISLENKLDRLEKSMTDSMKQIASTMLSYKSDLTDHMAVVKYKINQSSEINGTWKSTLVACCTFLVTFIIFIAYKKFLFRAMTWEEDE